MKINRTLPFYLGIRVTQFDGDITFQFILESDSLDTRNSFNNGRFTVSYVSNSADINGSLALNNLRTERGQFAQIN